MPTGPSAPPTAFCGDLPGASSLLCDTQARAGAPTILQSTRQRNSRRLVSNNLIIAASILIHRSGASEMAETTTSTTTTSALSTKTTPGQKSRTYRARPHLQALLHHRRRLALRRARVGAAHRADHRLPGRRHLRAERCRGAEGLVDDGDQHCRQQVSARPAGHALSARAACARSSPAWLRPFATGESPAATSAPPKTRPSSTTSSRTCSCSRRRRSTRRYGSTSAAIASSPTPTRRTGTGIPRRSVSNTASPATRRRSARPASSIR